MPSSFSRSKIIKFITSLPPVYELAAYIQRMTFNSNYDSKFASKLLLVSRERQAVDCCPIVADLVDPSATRASKPAVAGSARVFVKEFSLGDINHRNV